MVVNRIRMALRGRPIAFRAARAVWRALRPARRRTLAVRSRISTTLRAIDRPRRERGARRARITAWTNAGRPVPPPPEIKQGIVADHARLSGRACLVETGTYNGDMVFAQRRRFRRIFTIELDDRLFERATKRFERDPHVVVLHGDSGEVLPTLLESIRWPCVFWLDGHFSGGSTARGKVETPVIQELEAILRHATPGHVILIDDARCFGVGDYPPIDTLRAQVAQARPDWTLDVRDDVIRIHGPLARSA
jgi:predicted O-methyltransferase YrrM